MISGVNEFLDDDVLTSDEVNDEGAVVETMDEYGVISDDPPYAPPPEDINQNVFDDGEAVT